jgi:sugar lactone lactonase YvrE
VGRERGGGEQGLGHAYEPDVELLVDARAGIGEGPVWDAERRRLLWVDISGRLIHEFDPGTGVDTSWPVPLMVGAISLRRSGGLVMAMADGFWVCDRQSSGRRQLAPVEADRPENRMNDGKSDSRGRFWAGTMNMALRPHAGALYRLDPDGQVRTMVSPVGLSNGLGWSPDDRHMYYADSLAQSLDVFDYEPGEGRISNRTTLVEIPRQVGLPDGLCVDTEGFVWLAVFGAGEVRRYSPEGALDRTVRLPVSRVTCAAFGGAALDELYITSATEGVSVEQEPHAGGLFRHRPGVRGMPAFEFAG